jgi:hypothetical protein
MAIIEARSVGNALLGYPFRFEVNGYSTFLFQKVTVGKREAELVTFGGGGQTLDVKQAGGEKVTEFVLESIIPATGTDRRYWQDWQDEVRLRDTGIYWRDATLSLLGPDDEPNMIWDIEDCWPRLVEYEDFDTSDKKKLAKVKITLECNDFRIRLK